MAGEECAAITTWRRPIGEECAAHEDEGRSITTWRRPIGEECAYLLLHGGGL